MLTAPVVSSVSLALRAATTAVAPRMVVAYLVTRRSYSLFNRPAVQDTLPASRRFKSSFASEASSTSGPEMNIENSLFLNRGMNNVELGNYNRGLRLKYLKEKLDEERLKAEELERAIEDFKSNFL